MVLYTLLYRNEFICCVLAHDAEEAKQLAAKESGLLADVFQVYEETATDRPLVVTFEQIHNY